MGYLHGPNVKDCEAPQLDGLGSMRQGLDQSSGRYTGQADYSVFGQVIGGNNPGAFQSVYQWGAQSGYRMDGPSGSGGDAGLVKVGSRYYDPAVGRFTSRDSDLKQFPYAYCSGDPVNKTDASGHDAILSSGFSFGFSFGSDHYTYSFGAAFDLNNGDYELTSTPGHYNGYGLGLSAGPYLGLGSGTLSGFNGFSSGYNASLGEFLVGGVAYDYNSGYKGVTISAGAGIEAGAYMGIMGGSGGTRGGSYTFNPRGIHNFRDLR